jgi:hypothetical protein
MCASAPPTGAKTRQRTFEARRPSEAGERTTSSSAQLREGNAQAVGLLPALERDKAKEAGEHLMRVEVFYVPNCPHHPTAVSQLKAVLRAEGIPVEIHEVAVTNTKAAQELKFRGSPTVKINGRDIAGE